MSGRITVECLTAKEAAKDYGFDVDAEFCYVVISEGFKRPWPNETTLPPRTAVACQCIVFDGPTRGHRWPGSWFVEFMEDGEPQCNFIVATLDDALRICKDWCNTGRGVLL